MRRSLCPNDRQPLNLNILKPIPRIMRNLLDKLQIKCDFESNGCPQVFNLESLRPHVSICDFNPEKRVECLSGCGLVIKKADLQNHNCVKSLRKFISEENQRNDQNLSKIRYELNGLRNDNKSLKTLVNTLQNEVKRMTSEKQLTVISSAPSLSSRTSHTQASSESISGTEKMSERSTRVPPNPFVLITPLQSSSALSSMDEPSSSTFVSTPNIRLPNEEPAFKRRTTTTTIRVATPSSQIPMASTSLSHFPYRSSRSEEIVISRSPSPRFISSATTLTLSNDSNSEDNDLNANVSESLSHNYINLDDPELEDNTETGQSFP